MPWWLWAIGGYCAAVAVFVLCWAAVCTLRDATRRENEAMRLQIEAIECAELLRNIAVQSFMALHSGTFHAWAERMGNIRVSVQSTMHPFSDDGEN